MTLIHGDTRATNIFRRKGNSNEFAWIDWQGVSRAAPGIEMAQLLSASMGKLDDYKHVNEILAHYYELMASKSPAWVTEQYTKEMLIDDCAILVSLTLVCCSAVLFLPMLRELKPGDPPGMLGYWSVRMSAFCKETDALPRLRRLVGK